MTDETIQQVILEEVRNTRAELQMHRSESAERHESLEMRVRNTEQWQHNAEGKITIITTVGAFCGGVLTWVASRILE